MAQRIGVDAYRYIAVGFAAFLLHIAVFNSFVVVINPNVYAAQLVASAFSVTTAFVAHRRWTFARGGYATGWAVSAIRFVVVQITGASLPFASIWLARATLETSSLLIDNIAGNIVGLFLAFILRFFLSKYWVFRNEESN